MSNILTLKNFLKLFDYAKMLKKKYIYINNEFILGTDDDFCSLAIMNISDFSVLEEINKEYDINNLNIFFNKNEIIALIKDNKFAYIRTDNNEVSVVYDASGFSRLWVGHSREMNKVIKMASKITDITIVRPKPIIYQLDDIRTNSDITDTLSMKAGDGMNMLNLDSNIITMYGGMYPITAKDKVSMKLYDCEDGSILSEMIIYKPKYIMIKSYIRYRQLI